MTRLWEELLTAMRWGTLLMELLAVVVVWSCRARWFNAVYLSIAVEVGIVVDVDIVVDVGIIVVLRTGA